MISPEFTAVLNDLTRAAADEWLRIQRERGHTPTYDEVKRVGPPWAQIVRQIKNFVETDP